MSRPAWAERGPRKLIDRMKWHMRLMGYRPCPKCGVWHNGRPPHCPEQRPCPPIPE